MLKTKHLKWLVVGERRRSCSGRNASAIQNACANSMITAALTEPVLHVRKVAVNFADRHGQMPSGHTYHCNYISTLHPSSRTSVSISDGFTHWPVTGLTHTEITGKFRAKPHCACCEPGSNGTQRFLDQVCCRSALRQQPMLGRTLRAASYRMNASQISSVAV